MPVERKFSGAPAEPRFGYCRALRMGERILVSGTAAYDAQGRVVQPGNMHAQSVRCLEIIREAIEALGGGMEHVVRSRIYVTDIQRADEVGRAHAAAFGKHPPTATMVEVTALIDPDLVVEIEVEAWVGE